MVGTIIHVVNVDRKHGRKATVLWVHLLSYMGGSALLGGLLGGLGAGMRAEMPRYTQSPAVLLITGIVGMLYGLRELDLLHVPAPKVSRQVPSKWRLMLPPKQVALLYGLELGMGFTTYVTATTFYVAALWALLVGRPLLSALGMLAYGLGRAIPILWLGWQPTSSDERNKLVDALSPWTPMVHYVNGLALGFASAGLLLAGLLAG